MTAENIESPFNGMILQLQEKCEEYSFFIGGHLYGDPNTTSIFPASSLLANIDKINSFKAKFFISLGDNFRIADDINTENFKSAWCSKIKMPIFNAVGNHDVSRRDFYQGKFGKTNYHFAFNHELFIILDSELTRAEIVGDQLTYFINTINTFKKKPEIKNVFIFTHKLIWNIEPGYEVVFNHSNEKYTSRSCSNFRKRIKPHLIEMAKNKSVYWAAGDIGGGPNSLSLFFQELPGLNITYIATGIGDTARDAIIRVDIIENGGQARFIPISLSKQNLKNIEHYNLDYWNKYFNFENKSTKTCTKYKFFSKLKRTFMNKYFWRGVLLCSFIFFAIIFLRKWFKR
jgi:hypothetical protein